MLTPIRRLSCLMCLVLTAALLAPAQLRPDSAPEPKSQPKPSANLLVTADLDCDWMLDDKPQGRLKAGEIKSVNVSPGNYLVRASSSDGQDSWQTSVTVAGRKTLQIPLAGVRQARKEEVTGRKREEDRRQATWTDPATGLMWVRQDNGSNVTWKQAIDYCRTLSLLGYSDWRLSTIGELAAIYDQSQDVNRYHIKGGIRLSTCCQWSSTTTAFAEDAWFFTFLKGARDFSGLGSSSGRRALCVRRSGE